MGECLRGRSLLQIDKSMSHRKIFHILRNMETSSFSKEEKNYEEVITFDAPEDTRRTLLSFWSFIQHLTLPKNQSYKFKIKSNSTTFLEREKLESANLISSQKTLELWDNKRNSINEEKFGENFKPQKGWIKG